MFLSNIVLSSCVEPHYNQMQMHKCKRPIQATDVSIWYAFTDEIFGQSNCRLLNHATLTYTTYHLTDFCTAYQHVSIKKSATTGPVTASETCTTFHYTYTQMGINCGKRIQKKSTNAMTSNPLTFTTLYPFSQK